MTILADQMVLSSTPSQGTHWLYEGELLLGSERGPLGAGTIGPFLDAASAQRGIETMVREAITLDALRVHANVDLHGPAADLILPSATVVGAILTRRTADGKSDDWTLHVGASDQ